MLFAVQRGITDSYHYSELHEELLLILILVMIDQ